MLEYLLEPKKHRIGCQVHLLKDGGKYRYAVDLGVTKRRRFYPKSKSYWSRPATFTYTGNISRVGFVWWSPGMKKAGSLFRPVTLTDAPSHHELSVPGETWAFSCVALSGQHGMSAEGLFDQGKPSLTGRRPLKAAQLKPAALRPILEAIAGM